MSSGDPYERPDYLIREYQEARDTEQISPFSFDLNNIIDGLADENEVMTERVKKIRKVDVDHPIFDALGKLDIWYFDKDYPNGAKPAQDLLDQAIDRFDADNWPQVSYICILQKAKLLSRLPKHDFDTEVVRALKRVIKKDDLLSHPESIEIPDYLNSAHIYDLFELISKNKKKVSEVTQLYALEVASFGASKFSRRGRYMVEQDWLQHYIQLAKDLERDEETLGGYVRLLDSYEALVKGTDKQTLKASFLHDALLKTQVILTTEDQKQLTGRIQEYERKGVESGEYVKIEKTIEKEKLQGYFDTFEIRFERERSRVSAVAALWASATWSEFFPSYQHITEAEPRINDMLSQRTTDTEYNPISVTEAGIDGKGDQVPVAYTAELQLNDQLLVKCLRTLIEDDKLAARDFHGVIHSIPGLSADDIKFLESAADYSFEGKYDATFHISITRLEGVVKRALQSRGEVTNALKPDESIEQRGLEGLIDDIILDRDPDLGYYLRYKYSNKDGQNLRNRAAHSQMFYAEMTPSMALLVLYDVLRAGIRIEHNFRN